MSGVFFIFLVITSLVRATEVVDLQKPEKKVIHIERDPGEPVCDEELKNCTYLVQNSSAAVIVARMKDEIFNGIPPGGNTDGDHLSAPNPGYITFWHHVPEELNRMKKFVVEADRFDHFIPNVVVPLTIEVFEATDDAISQFEATIGINSTEKGKLQVSLKDSLVLLRTAKVSASLLALRTTRDLEFKTTVRVPVPNLESFRFEHTTPNYTSFPAAPEVKTDRTGIEVRGEVTVSHEQQDVVRIKNLGITYGVTDFKNPDKIISLDVSAPPIDLPSGVTYYMVSADSVEVSTKKTVGILHFGRNKETLRKKLLVTIRASAMPWAEYIAQLASDETNPTRPAFSEEEKKSFCPQGNLKAVFNSLEPYNLRTPNGVPVIGFRLNPNLATQDTYQQFVNVTVDGPGFKQARQMQVENLMLNGGFLFKALPEKLKSKTVLEFHVTLDSVNMHDGKFIQAKQHFDLNYNPQNNLLTRKGVIPEYKPITCSQPLTTP